MFCKQHLLADHLLDNGVIVPPCKVGDTVYWLDDSKIKQGEVFEISLHSDGLLVHTGTRYCLERVFPTREEAEKSTCGQERGMKYRKCPLHKHCFDYKYGNCDDCEIGKSIDGLHKKVDRLKTENLKLKAENEKLKSRIDVLLNPSF